MRINLLATLKPDDLALLEPHLKKVELEKGFVLAHPGDDMEYVYSPNSGIVSFLVSLESGAIVQTMMVGRCGPIGAAQALDDKRSVNKIMVQVSGAALMMHRDYLRMIVQERPEVRQTFNAHDQFVTADVQQTAACNAAHSVDQRCARWLLRMRDLLGSTIPITQQELADMLCIRRTSVVEAMQAYRANRAVESARGEVVVTDAKRLESAACECHRAMRENYEELFGCRWPRAA